MIQLYFFQILSAYVDETVKIGCGKRETICLTMNGVHDLQTSVWVLVPETFKDEIHVTCGMNLSERELVKRTKFGYC
jgi:hypothetical protein